MMIPNPITHLTYDELLRTLTDPSDLSTEQQAHLESCRRCRRQAQTLQHRYRRLGRMARELAPAPSRSFRVSSQAGPQRRWYYKPGVAAAMIGVLVFVFTMWWPQPPDHTRAPSPMEADATHADARLMAEVDALVEDALPVAYQQVAVVSEPILSQDLIDWIVPDIDSETDKDDQTREPRA